MQFESKSGTAARTEDGRPGRPGVAHVDGLLMLQSYFYTEASIVSTEAYIASTDASIASNYFRSLASYNVYTFAFEQILSFILQSAFCWTRGGDRIVVGFVKRNVPYFFTPNTNHHQPRVVLIYSAVDLLRVRENSIPGEKTSRRADAHR